MQVAEKPIYLKNLEVIVRECGTRTLQQLQQNERFTLLLTSLPLTTRVYSAGAVIGYAHQELITVGSYVQFSAGIGEVRVSVFLTLCAPRKLRAA